MSQATHRHTAHEHEHEFEAARGLPEALPDGERIVWQGAPTWTTLARSAFHVRKLSFYFAALVALRIGSAVMSDESASAMLVAAAMAVLVAGVGIGLVTLLAWLSARTTLYTITNRRVIMRVGIVLTVTFNLPFKRIEAADLHALPAGHGDIALTLDPATRIAYPHLWPHARPWKVARTQPSLRSIPDAQGVAQLLTQAWRAETGAAVVELPQARPSRAPASPQSPALEPLDVAQAA